MTEEKELNLIERYPALLSRFKKRSPSCSFKIWCDDGWYDLIYNSLAKIHTICDLSNLQIEVVQIKEKLGELVILYEYMNEDSKNQYTTKEIIKDVVKSSSESSKRICEVSGLYGTLCSNGSSLYKTLNYKVTRNKEKYKEYYPLSNSIAELWNSYDKRV